MPYVYSLNGGGRKITKELILKASVSRIYNTFNRDYGYSLNTHLQLNKKSITHVISRLVYWHFVSEFDEDMRIDHKNNDPFDNAVENIELSSRKAIVQKAYKRGRIGNAKLLHHFVTSKRLPEGEKFEAVSQYEMNGNLIAIHDCIQDAAKSIKMQSSNIRLALNREKISAAGFLWCWGEGPSKISVKFTEVLRREAVLKRCKGVTQYDLNGNRIRTYASIVEATKAVNGTTGIYNTLRKPKEIRVAYGFIWKAGQGPKKIKVST